MLFLHCGGTTQSIMVGNHHYDSISSVAYTSPGKIDHPVKVSVVAFENKTHYGRRQLEKVASDILSSELVKSEKFVVIEREKLNVALEELSLSQTGIIDDTQALEVGKLIGAEIIITGSVSQFGCKTEGSDAIFHQSKCQICKATVDVRLIKIETTKVVAAITGKGTAQKKISSFMGAGGKGGYDETLEGEALRAAIIDVVQQLIDKNI
jgi:curli biogenesis system outer membrane secretion channel CsgG